MISDDFIGVTIGENSISSVEFISTEIIQQGLYVCMESGGVTVLGMVSEVHAGNLLFDEEIRLPEDIEQIRRNLGYGDEYTRASVKILGDIDTLEIPKVALASNTHVRMATTSELNSVFNNNDGLNIGHITTSDGVDINLDADQLVSKHLAILAMTGSGKSNTTAVLIDELLKIHGCILLFDMHSEYCNIEFPSGTVNRIEAQINLFDLTDYEIAKLAGISSQASTQERVLSKAIQMVKDEMNERIKRVPKDYPDANEASRIKIKKSIIKEYKLGYIDMIMHKLSTIRNDASQKNKESIDATKAKLNHKLNNKYKAILDEDMDEEIVKKIKPNCVNIVDFGGMEEYNSRVIIEKLLKDTLKWRKNAKLNNGFTDKYLNYPVFCIIEEAHTLISTTEENSGPKYYIQKIAKEGRKFGVGLGLVSQRPKTLDSDILSQVNNWIVLKIVEPGDQRYIQECSDNMSNDLIKELPSLNTGEAIITGPMITMPSIAKIKFFKGKKIGENIKISSEWDMYYKKNIRA